LSNIAVSIVSMLYNMQLLKLAGENGIAAYGVIAYLSFIFSSVFFGYAIGASPIISYHYGAQNNDELKNLLKKSIVVMLSIGILMTALAEALAKPLSMIFVSYDKDLLDMTVRAMRIYAAAFTIVGFNVFASAFFTALNNGLASALISLLRTLVFQIFAVMVLPLIWKLNGVWAAVIVAEGLSVITSALFLLLNRKKYKY